MCEKTDSHILKCNSNSAMVQAQTLKVDFVVCEKGKGHMTRVQGVNSNGTSSLHNK